MESTEANFEQPKPRTIMRELPCKLTDAELAKVTREHVDLEIEIEGHVAQRSEINAKIRPKSKRSRELVHKLDTGTELRQVRCEVHERHGNQVEIIRTDTGQSLETRTMTAEERQGDWLASAGDHIEEAKQEKKKPAKTKSNGRKKR